jgi:hypothetical protein
MDVYLEIGKKKTFAGALYWPGWCRSARDEESALQALVDYAPRYREAVNLRGIAFDLPVDPSAFNIYERLEGTATTDFGAPDIAPSVDSRPLDEDELQHQLGILQACWDAFDAAAQAALGKDLRLGPRGGGRSLERVMRHVFEADAGYLSRLAVSIKMDQDADIDAVRKHLRETAEKALISAVRDGMPESGPRGGKLWTPRYFIRRMTWHELDHAWELQDRIL